MKRAKSLELVNKTMKKFLDGYIAKEILLPISLVIVLITASVWVGSLANQVSEIQKKDSPSRYEFDSVTTQLTEIKTGVDSINNFLREK